MVDPTFQARIAPPVPRHGATDGQAAAAETSAAPASAGGLASPATVGAERRSGLATRATPAGETERSNADIARMVLAVGLAALLVVSVLGLTHAIRPRVSDGAMTTVFTTSLAGLLGLLVKGPDSWLIGRKSRSRDRSSVQRSTFAGTAR